MTPQEVSLIVYNLALLPVVAVSVVFLLLSLLSIFMDSPARLRKMKAFPRVTVQIPSFNDAVAARCIKACLELDYPKDRYDIMILDDSTDVKTQKLLKNFEKPGFVSYIHRTDRSGYKPGALQKAMHLVKGDIIVIFDADFVPKKDFLKRMIQPFEDPKVAIVQGAQGSFLNKDFNLISRFAAYMLMMQQAILMPINNKLNSVFFGGTAGAIRKRVIDEAGGWNAASITEDTDLSIRILSMGYKSVYVNFDTPSEVPITLESFIKQQVRWTFGNMRAFIDHSRTILFKRGLSFGQRVMITFGTTINIMAPAVIIMTFAGLSGWFLGEPQLLQFAQVQEFIIKMFYTVGFIIMGVITFYKQKRMKELPQLVLALMSLSIILAFANSVAVFKAIFQKDKPLYPDQKNSWICTPKQGNVSYEND